MIVFASLLLTVAASAAAEDVERFLSLVDRMEDRISAVRDYTCVFTKQERVRGEWLPEETIFMKHRGPAVCLYMKWIAEPHLGRESIFCEGRYDGEMQVREGSGIARWFPMSLAPEGTVAMRFSRRPVTQAGLFNGVRFITLAFRGWRDGRTENAARRTFRRVWDEAVHGQPSLCADTVPPARDDSARDETARSEICIHTGLELPTRMETWDAAGLSLGRYTYRDLRLNVGLGDDDFDVRNEEYGF